MSRKMIKHHQIMALTLSLVLLSGCVTIVHDGDSGTTVSARADCEGLAQEFDRKVELMDYSKLDGVPVGAALVGIEEKYVEYNGDWGIEGGEYIYTLKFKGLTQEDNVLFPSKEQVVVPLEVGQFYQFDYRKACGLVTSMGPHHGMIQYADINDMFKPVSC